MAGLVSYVRHCTLDSPILCVCSCGESPPPPPVSPPLVLAACLLKTHLDGKLLDWRVILNVLPDQVYVRMLLLLHDLHGTNLTKVVFILMDFAVRLMVTLAPVNNHFIDLIKV